MFLVARAIDCCAVYVCTATAIATAAATPATATAMTATTYVRMYVGPRLVELGLRLVLAVVRWSSRRWWWLTIPLSFPDHRVTMAATTLEFSC